MRHSDRARSVRSESVWRGLLFLAAMLLWGCRGARQAPTEPWQATFEDDTGWVASSDAVADVTIAEGRLRIHVYNPGQIAWAFSEGSWSDLHLTVEATQISGPHDNEYGVLLRMKDDQHFLAFSISGDGYARVARFESGRWTVIGPDWVLSDAVLQGEATNRLEVIARGSSLDFLVNDQRVLQVEDAAPAEGRVGVYAGAFTEGDVVVAFDNLSVELLP
jgi:hypothetical protein